MNWPLYAIAKSALFFNANTEWGLFFTIAATVTVKFLADITAKVSQLFNGIQIQSPITVNHDQTPAATVTAPDAPAEVNQ